MEKTTPASNATILSSALALFEKGDYDEVLTLASGTTDPALMLLAARSYLATGKLDIAETLLRSLLSIMPNSSYLHSYLGDVLDKKEDKNAVAEYAEALALDPDNKAAVRCYAKSLIKRNDLRAAIPALRAAVRAENNTEDIKLLEEIFTKVGEPEETITLHQQYFKENTVTIPYAEALFAVGEIQKCLETAHHGWDTEKNTAYLRIFLEALTSVDKDTAEKAFREALNTFEADKIDDENVTSIRFSFVLLEKLLGKYDIAKLELKPLLTNNADAVFYLVSADIAAQEGDKAGANAIYRNLIATEMEKESTDWDTAELIIDRFALFLSDSRNGEEVAGTISIFLSTFTKAVALAKIGEAYEVANSLEQAKDWYYRAYRADTIRGGCAYAGFLKRTDKIREAETTLRYILTSLKTTADLERAANAILNGDTELYKLDHTRELVQKKLAATADELSATGREMLASLYLYSAVDALENRNFEDCKWFCLAGIDVLPCYPDKIHIQDFSDLLIRAKGRALSERPILMEKVAAQTTDEVNTTSVTATTVAAVTTADEKEEEIIPNLDEREMKIIAFIRDHREATEMDLRALLDTRRVAGIINSLIEKTAGLGVTLIEKRGTGERGEIYGYVGNR